MGLIGNKYINNNLFCKWNLFLNLIYGVAHSDQYETEKNKIIEVQ